MTTKEAKRLKTLEEKVARIERNMAFFVPKESLKDYKNRSEI